MSYAGLILKKGIRWATVLCLLVILAMFLTLLVTRAGEPASSKIHPALQALVEEQPDAHINVIVQKAGYVASLEEVRCV